MVKGCISFKRKRSPRPPTGRPNAHDRLDCAANIEPASALLTSAVETLVHLLAKSLLFIGYFPEQGIHPATICKVPAALFSVTSDASVRF
jgi:hypothetical protein